MDPKIITIKSNGKSYKYRVMLAPTRSGKKYEAIRLNSRNEQIGRPIRFGAIGYAQFQDKIGHFSDLDHLDMKRREDYRSRHRAINNKTGPAYKDPNSASFLSWHLLW